MFSQGFLYDILGINQRTESMSIDTEVFESTPVKRAVFLQSIPAVISQMITLLYNWADTYFISALGQPELVAAATAVLPVYLLLSAIGNLPGVGGGSRLSNCLGEKNYSGGRTVCAAAFWMGAVLALLFCASFPLFKTPLMLLIGADEHSIAAAEEYAFWVITLGGAPVILNLVLSHLVRAEGLARQASMGLAMGGILNVILDPLLILPEYAGLGIAGAGIATFASNAATLVYFLVLIIRRRKDSVLTLSPRYLAQAGRYIGPILKIGSSSSMQYLLTVLAVAAQTHFVSAYGTSATAALGIVKRLDYLPLYFTIGVSQGMLPLVAYNHSSRNSRRRNDIFRFSCIVSECFSLFCLVIYELFAPQLALFFIKDSVTVAYIVPFLRSMVVAMPFMALCYPMITFFQATGEATGAFVCSILRKGVVDIPLLMIMDSLFPLYGCMWVQPIVDFVSLAAAFGFYCKVKSQ